MNIIKRHRSFRKEIDPSEYDYVRSTGTPYKSGSTYGNFSLGAFQSNLMTPSRWTGCFQMYLPSTPANGCFYESGGTSLGMWIGVRDSGTNFRVRAGAGNVTSETNACIFLTIPVTDMPFDGSIHTVIVDMKYLGPGARINLFVDRKFVARRRQNSASFTYWSGAAQGVFINGGANVSTTGEPTDAWDNTAGQSYRIFRDEYVIKDSGTYSLDF